MFAKFRHKSSPTQSYKIDIPPPSSLATGTALPSWKEIRNRSRSTSPGNVPRDKLPRTLSDSPTKSLQLSPFIPPPPIVLDWIPSSSELQRRSFASTRSYNTLPSPQVASHRVSGGGGGGGGTGAVSASVEERDFAPSKGRSRANSQGEDWYQRGRSRPSLSPSVSRDPSADSFKSRDSTISLEIARREARRVIEEVRREVSPRPHADGESSHRPTMPRVGSDTDSLSQILALPKIDPPAPNKFKGVKQRRSSVQEEYARSLPKPMLPAFPDENLMIPRRKSLELQNRRPPVPVPRAHNETCAVCGKRFASGNVVVTDFGVLHMQCFACHQCGCSLEHTEFYLSPQGDRLYCHFDYHEIFSNKCEQCNTAIESEGISVFGRHYHKDHFFCHGCSSPLSDEFFLHRDLPVCRRCYEVKTAESCWKCKQQQTHSNQLLVEALGRLWCSNCLICEVCTQCLVDRPFVLRTDGMISCESCETREIKSKCWL